MKVIICYENPLHCKGKTYCYIGFIKAGKYILECISTRQAANIVRGLRMKVDRAYSSYEKGKRASITFR